MIGGRGRETSAYTRDEGWEEWTDRGAAMQLSEREPSILILLNGDGIKSSCLLELADKIFA